LDTIFGIKLPLAISLKNPVVNNFGKIYLIIRVLQVILKYEEKYV